MKKLLFAISLCLMSLFVSAQTEFDLLKYENMGDFYGIEACADNGVLYFGSLDQDPTTEFSIFGELAAYLTKRNKNGLIEWSKVIGGDYDEQIISVEESPSGEIILLGYQGTDYGDDSLFVMKLDAQGDMIWEKKIGGYEAPSMAYPGGVDFLSLDENGLIYFLTPTGNTRYEDYAVITMNPANGQIIASKAFKYTTTRAEVKSLEVISEGIVLVSGTINDSGKIRAFLLKYDLTNEIVLLSKRYNIGDYYYISETLPTKDGGYAFTGNISSASYSNIITVKLDANGDVEWGTKIGNSESRLNATSLHILKNNGIAISGFAQPESGANALYSFIGNDGKVKFSQKIEGSRAGILSAAADRIYLGNEISYTEVNTAIADTSGIIYTSNASFYFDLPTSSTSLTSQELSVAVSDIVINAETSNYYVEDYETERAPLQSGSRPFTKIIEGVTLLSVHADKFYSFTGASRTEGNYTDLYFLQLDQYGNKTRENNTDMASISYDEGEEIIGLSQNNFLVRNNYEGHIQSLVKYNSDGSYNTGKVVRASNYATISGSSLQFTDGSIFYAGKHRPASGGRTNVIATKLDEDLNVTWSKSYGYTGVYFDSEFIFGDSDGNIIMNIGQTYPTLLKTNENGDILWCKKLDISGRIREFYEVPGTGYVCVSDDYFLKIDYDGNILSAKDFSQNRVNDLHFTKCSNGGYFCTFAQEIDGKNKLSAIQFDADFNIFWHRYYNIDFYVRDVAENKNGEFIIVGRNGTADKGYIFMLDQFGNPSTECFNFETDITFTTPDVTVAVSDVNIESYDEVAEATVITDTEHYLTSQDKTDIRFEYASSFENISCFGKDNGSIEIEVNGGIEPIKYKWSNGESAAALSGLAPGTYNVSVSDFLGCEYIEEFNIEEPEELSFLTVVSDVSCFGGTNGTATAIAEGGTEPYSYFWSNGNRSETNDDLFAGEFFINVSDYNGCNTAPQKVTISQPDQLQAHINSNEKILCFGASTAEIEAMPAGGTEPYSYEWSTGETAKILSGVPAGEYSVAISDSCGETVSVEITVDQPDELIVSHDSTNVSCFAGTDGSIALEIATGQSVYAILWSESSTSETISGLAAGDYSYTVTDGCQTVSETVSISQPDDLALTIDKSDISCNGLADGSATAIVEGGTAPYIYNWSNGLKTAQADNLFKGTYNLQVVDHNGCSIFNTVSIAEPEKLTASLEAGNNSCFGGSEGSITVHIAGGVEDYAFDWSNGATTQNVTDVAAGTYTVTISDACNEELVKTASITEPGELSVSSIKTDVTCKGEANGTISLNVEGGTLPYSYAWSNAAITPSIYNLDVDTYSVTVTDNCGVTSTVAIEIAQPDSLLVDVATKDISCYGNLDGTATASVSGGTEPYNYIWNNGQTSRIAVGLFQGKHTVNIVDARGCNASNSGVITQPEQLAVSFAVENNDCYGGFEGSIAATIESGLLPVSYNWDDGSEDAAITNLAAGIYTVTITDACGDIQVQSVEVSQIEPVEITVNAENITCNGKDNGSIEITPKGGAVPHEFVWSNGAETNLITGLSSDIYTVIITDNCNTKFYDTIQITEPEPLDVAIDANDIECFGTLTGSAIATASGGTQPYNYIWNNGQRKQTAINLFPGQHTVNVLDANGCSAANSVIISQPLPMSVNTATEHVSCHGGSSGSVAVSVTNGAQPYSYEWSIADSTQSRIANLTAGIYTVTVTDACNEVYTESIMLSEPSPLQANELIKNVQCFGQTNGAVAIEAINGAAPYSIHWSNDSESFEQTGLAGDTLVYTVSDQCGDSVSDTIIINQPDMFDIEVITTDATCYGKGDGTASVQTAGGVAPFIYNWSIGLQNETLQGLYPGEYSVNVFDANGCLASENYTIDEPLPLSVQTFVTDAECGNDNGMVSATAEGGVAPYTYNWSIGIATDAIENVPHGTYDVEVTDVSGCTVTADCEVGVYAPVVPICMLTVDRENGKNKVVWEKIFNSSITSVNVFRMVGGEYQHMGTVDSSALSYYDDMLSNPQVTAARYAITTNDACGNESDFSFFHQTIHLGAAKGNDGASVILDWTEYMDESGQFVPQWYYLYRGTTAGNLQLFDSVDARVATEYNDIDPQGAVYYQVAVKKEFSCVATGRLKNESGPFSQSMSNLAESIVATKLNNLSDIACILYPNPSNGEFVLQVGDYAGFAAEITNITGQVVWQGKLSATNTKIDIKKEAIGIYTLSLRRGNTLVSELVLKEE